MIKNPKKIHIAGPVGSGKTTLATYLGKVLALPTYSLDDFVWERQLSGDCRRSVKERDHLLKTASQKPTWIIEGAQSTWIEPSIKAADLVVLLDLPFAIRQKQILERFSNQISGLEAANYVPTKEIFKQINQWNQDYEDTDRHYFLNLLQPISSKLIIIHSKNELIQLKQRF